MKKNVFKLNTQIPNMYLQLLFLSLLFSGFVFCQENDLKPWEVPISEKQMNKLPAKGPYFLVDDRIIEDRWMIERFVVPLEKYSNNPVVEKEFPWEGSGPLMGGTVLFEEKYKLFKMWYLVWDEHAYYNKLPFSYNICYAESKNGIKWDKPILNLFDRRGTIDKINNFIALGRQKTQGIDVELNPSPNSPAEKYIAIHNDSGGVFVSYSADGKDFKCSFENPAVWYHSDTRNNIVFDETRKRWFMFVRPRAYAGEGLKKVNRRRIAVKESDDLVHWTHERTIIVPEEGDVTDFYGMTVFRRGDMFIGFLQIYDAGKTDKVSSELVWSDDAYHWSRLPLGAKKTPLNYGKENDWDAGQVYMADKPIIQEDEMWFYYTGNKTAHNVPGAPAIGLAKTKTDRFFGARSLLDTLGRILTRPFEVNGDLFINADVEGEIRVEVRSAIRDELLEGWGADDCTPIVSSSLNAFVSWGGKKLSELNGKIVRLRFQLKDGTLYSFNIL